MSHGDYVGELLNGQFHDATRDGVVGLVTRLRQRDGIDGVLLAGTELPLLLPGGTIAGLESLDTTAVHVAAIVERLREPR
jgi:aspartate racemase